MKKRIDLLLVEKGLASSRTKAQDLIAEGKVFVLEKGIRKVVQIASENFENPQILLEESNLEKYVSRAGLKLEGALSHLGLSVQGFRVLDVGQSTGGFTDCCLQKGALEVVGVEVGKGQLAEKLKKDFRVCLHEEMNARELRKELPNLGLFDLAVLDLSFISLTLVLPEVIQFTNQVLALVKPQFEVGPEGLGKGGIVKDSSHFQNVENKIKKCVQELGFKVMDYFPSSPEGKDGNREFFIYFKK